MIAATCPTVPTHGECSINSCFGRGGGRIGKNLWDERCMAAGCKAIKFLGGGGGYQSQMISASAALAFLDSVRLGQCLQLLLEGGSRPRD